MGSQNGRGERSLRTQTNFNTNKQYYHAEEYNFPPISTKTKKQTFFLLQSLLFFVVAVLVVLVIALQTQGLHKYRRVIQRAAGGVTEYTATILTVADTI